jgi:hypothetical protein
VKGIAVLTRVWADIVVLTFRISKFTSQRLARIPMTKIRILQTTSSKKYPSVTFVALAIGSGGRDGKDLSHTEAPRREQARSRTFTGKIRGPIGCRKRTWRK